jgi:drug/metabolite transporter (DMT)-like permease
VSFEWGRRIGLSTPKLSRERAAEALLVWNALIWGATFVVVKSALLDISPLYFLALRFSLATIALVAIFRGVGKTTAPSGHCSDRAAGTRDWKSVGAGVLIGSLLFTGYLTQTLGLRLTSAPKSAFITGLCSVLVPVLAAVVYRIRPQVSEVAGVLVATVGMGLMTLHGSIGAISQGDLLTLACAFAFAAQIVTLGHYSGRVSFELLAVTQVATSAVWSWALLWWVEKPHVQWRPSLVCAILVTGLLATALAFTIQSWAQRYTTSTRTALIYMLEPVTAWLTSYFLTGEGLSGRAAAGAGLILGGVVLVEVKPWASRPHPS